MVKLLPQMRARVSGWLFVAGNHQQGFLEVFLRHAHDMLAKQDEYSHSQWVRADAAKASNMKRSETLRYALTSVGTLPAYGASERYESVVGFVLLDYNSI